MKNKRNILIAVLLILLIGLAAYSYYNKLINDRLKTELQDKTDRIAEIERASNIQPPFIRFVDAEKLMIERIKETDAYKTDLSHIGPNNYLKFENDGFTTDGLWYFGMIGYTNMHTATDSFYPPEGELFPMISEGYSYILKYDYAGKIETLSISHVTDREEWNENLEKLPDSIMPKNRIKYYILPIKD